MIPRSAVPCYAVPQQSFKPFVPVPLPQQQHHQHQYQRPTVITVTETEQKHQPSPSQTETFQSHAVAASVVPHVAVSGSDLIPSCGNTSVVVAPSANAALQYRIYKRGDQIPGISEPPIVFMPNLTQCQSLTHQQQENVPNNNQNLIKFNNVNVIPNSNNKSNSNNTKNANTNKKTPTTLVIELAKFNGLKAEYRLVKQEGPPHCPTFTVQLHLGQDETYVGTGPSIKRAQLVAAESAIQSTQLRRPIDRSQGNQQQRVGPRYPKNSNPTTRQFRRNGNQNHLPPRTTNDELLNPSGAEQQQVLIPAAADKNPISMLYEICMRGNVKVEYTVIAENGPPHSRMFTLRCQVQKGDFFETAEAEGPTKQHAKKVASELMLEKLQVLCSSDFSLSQDRKKPLTKKKPNYVKPQIIRETEDCPLSPISKLMQIVHDQKLKDPVFELITDDSKNNQKLESVNQPQRKGRKLKHPVFTTRVTVGTISAQGSGSNKKQSKNAAAEALLRGMGFPVSTYTTTGKRFPISTEAVATPAVKTSGSDEKEIKFTSGKQLVPGIIVLNRESQGNANSSDQQQLNTAEEDAVDQASSSQATEESEHMDKLSYLTKLLGVHLSFSDFPKRNEFLSVVSMSTNPPHVAHGIGPTMLQARNQASLKILEELANTGIDPQQSA